MFRRSRFSVRPNVGTAGRTAAAPQETPPVNQESGDIASNNTDTAIADKSVTQSENSSAQGDGNDHTAESNTSSAAVQRRKRFSVKPKVIPGRPSILARATKSPVKAVKSPVKAGHETPVDVSEKAENRQENDSESVAAPPRRLQSPRRRRPSEDSQQPAVQPKSVSSDSSAAASEDLQKESHQLADVGKKPETMSDRQVKESHFKVPEKVLPSLPSKGAAEISEKAKALVSSKFGVSTSAAAYSLSRLLNDPSDLHRLAKARKLRELLKEEIHKERRLKKSKMRPREFTLDPAKMTMRDLIHYLPESNPMTSCLEGTAPEDETVVPPLPGTDDPPERAQEPAGSQRGEEEEEEEAAADGDQEEALLVPQVKVAEDGTLIIDESSLTVEVQRAKGPNLIQDRDPIFERGSTTTYSSFRKGTYSKPWSAEETDMFFLAVSMVGTDFTMICQLFPHRARSEIKNKFKKEERQNSWRIDKAFRERRKLDIEYFSKLLEMILEVQKNRKKHKSLADKNGPKKKRRKTKGKKPHQKMSDEEEEEEEIPDLEDDEEEGGVENEDVCKEGQAPASQPKKQCKRRRGQDPTADAPDEGKKKLRDNSEQDKVGMPEDAEASHLEDDANPDSTEPTTPEGVAVKPDKPPPGRTARPLPRSSRKCDEKLPSSSKTDKNDTCDADESENDAEEQQSKKIKLADEDDDVSSDGEEARCEPLKPTRYGRMPKPTKPLTYPTKEDTHSSPTEDAPASPMGLSAPRPKSKCPAKKKGKMPSAPEPKRPKLITLRASQSEYSDDEDENQGWPGPEQQLVCGGSRDSTAAFVPASLCSLHPVTVEVEETMEELDILASMPDVLGISQDALTVENETCSAEPREHQLDLLVDVIDCLPPEYTVSEEESYNEAAQTLLTISNLAHGTQSADSSAVKDQSEAVSANEQTLETEQAPASVSENRETSVQGNTDSPVANTEPQKIQNDISDPSSGSDQKTEPPPKPPPSPEKQEQMPSQTRRSRITKIKPNPVLSRISRPIESKTQPETSKGSVEGNEAAPSSCDATQIPSGAEVNKTEMNQKCFSEESREEKVPEAAAGSQENQGSNEIKLSLEPMTSDETLRPESTDSASGKINSAKDSAVTQTRSSHFQKAKPNLPVTSKAACSTSQTTQDSKSTPDPPQKSAKMDVPSLAESQDLGLESAPPEKAFTADKEKADPEVMRSSVATSDQIISDNQHTQEANAEISSKSIDGKINPHTIEVETSPGPAAFPGSVPVQEISDLSCENTEDPAVCQKGVMEPSTVKPVKKARFPKVKPKPNLASASRTVRSGPQSTNNTKTNPLSAPQSSEETVEGVTEPPVTTSPVTSPGSGSGLIPTPDTSSSLAVTEGLTVPEAEQRHGGFEGGEEPTVDQRTVDHKDELVQPEQPEQQVPAKATAPTPKTIGNTSDSEGLAGPGPAIMTPHAQESSHPPSKEDLPFGQEEMAPTCQTRKGRRVKPKPNLPQASRVTQPKPQNTGQPVLEQSYSPGALSCVNSAPAPTCHQIPERAAPSATSELGSTETPAKVSSAAQEQGSYVGPSERREIKEPQTRRRFPKAKPNLGSSARNIPKEAQASDASEASEQHQVDTTVTPEQHTQMVPQPLERGSQHFTSLEVSGDGQNNEATTSVGVAIATRALAETESAWGDWSTGPTGDAADISEVRSSEHIPSETEMNSVSAELSSGVKESPPEVCSEGESRDVGPSEMTEARSLAQSTRGDQSKQAASAKPAGKAQTRRGRLVKPKPNLGQNSRTKQIQSITPTGEDSGGSAEGQPAGGAVEQQTAEDAASSEVLDRLDEPQHDPDAAGSSLGCFAEVTGYTQALTTSDAAENQIQEDFRVFSEMLSGQVPADPDEPFFILSLTEIPVCSLGEMVDSPSEKLPLLPVPELPQQQSVSEHCLDEPLAHLIESTEESGQLTVRDMPPDHVAHKGSDLGDPADPHESTPQERSTSPETEHQPPEQRPRHSPSTAPITVPAFSSGASKQPQRKKCGRKVSEHEGHLQNVTPGGGTDPGARTTRTEGVSASSTLAPAASASHSGAVSAPPQQGGALVLPPPAPPQPAEDVGMTSDAEENRAEHNDPQDEEPPTSVSQYFLSDIFTEVED